MLLTASIYIFSLLIFFFVIRKEEPFFYDHLFLGVKHIYRLAILLISPLIVAIYLLLWLFILLTS